jgi:hypothetical protein
MRSIDRAKSTRQALHEQRIAVAQDIAQKQSDGPFTARWRIFIRHRKSGHLDPRA